MFPSFPVYRRRLLSWLLLAPVLTLPLLLAVAMVPAPAHAATAAQPFAIAFDGKISSSHVTSGNAGGAHTAAVEESIQSAEGQYPNLVLTLSLTQTYPSASQASTFIGKATILSPSSQTTLFTATVQGKTDAQGLATWQLFSVTPALGTRGDLQWQANDARSKTGIMNGHARGTFQFPDGTPHAVMQEVWPALVPTASVHTADPTFWYLTRGAASAAYVVLIIATALGIGISTQAFDSVTRRPLILDLHQVMTLVGLGFVLMHLITLILDPYLPFSIGQILLPFTTTFRPIPTALGVLGLYLLILVALTSWLRGRLSYAVWHALHYSSYLLVALVTLHGMLTGTDSNTPWMIATYVTGLLVVTVLSIVRIIQAIQRDRYRRAVRLAGR